MSLKDDVLKILTYEIGPAAPRFLDRQCKSHLNKDPDTLDKSDIFELAKWCEIGVKISLDEAAATRIKIEILKLK